MTPVLEIKDLVKHYPKVKAVNGATLKVKSGTCFGLLGPNGAGKTTTIEIMEGILKPTSGQIFYKGTPLSRRYRHEVGIQFQSTALQHFLTVRNNLNLFSRFYKKTRRIDELISLCALENFIDQDVRKISGGQRQRLLLALALINDPELVFLDEPTTGLDPQSRRNFWTLIENIKKSAKTVVLTTHYMEEAYRLCDEIAIMDHGKIIAQGTPETLLAEHFKEAIMEMPHQDFTLDPELFPASTFIKAGMVEIPSQNVNETLEQLLKLGLSLQNLKIRPPTLEDLYLELTGKELRT